MDLSAAHSIIWKVMLDHKLFDLGWSFEWDHAKSRCGQCRFADRKITISKHFALINDEEAIRDTILHEIAHALVGPGHHHGLIWKLKAQEIGAKPLLCSTNEKQVPGKYIGRCVGCGVEVYRYRKPRYIDIPGWYRHISCRRAGRKAEIEWKTV